MLPSPRMRKGNTAFGESQYALAVVGHHAVEHDLIGRQPSLNFFNHEMFSSLLSSPQQTRATYFNGATRSSASAERHINSPRSDRPHGQVENVLDGPGRFQQE